MKIRPIDWILMFGIAVVGAACVLIVRAGFELQENESWAIAVINQINGALKMIGLKF